MPVLSVDQLITPLSLSTARTVVINLLKSLGFAGAPNWAEGSMPRTLGVELPAYLLSDLSKSVANIARAGFNDTAEGPWLTLYSLSAYDNERDAGVRTTGQVVLTSVPTAPPHNIAPGKMIASDGQGHTFRNTGVVSIAPNTVQTVEVAADVAGVAGNVAINTLKYLHTTHVGLSINNPGVSGQWITVWGADEESDEELRTRNRKKWATRAYGGPGDAYEFWALEANPVITRPRVIEGDALHPGEVHIYVAGKTGALPQVVADDVTDYINGDVDNIVRRPLGARVFTHPATQRVVEVAGTVWISAEYQTTAPSQVQAQIDTLFEKLPIGGESAGGVTGLLFSKLYRAVMTVPGVINVHFTSPTADTPMVPTDVATLSPLSVLTFEPVG
jgi:uncharacterized phage protein gp47/JayE